MSDDADVVVVGGGPGGATAATLTARRGHRVVLLERETFPRFQIGESLLPATVHGICRLLGVADEVAAAGFAVKRGGSFRWGTGAEPWNFLFAISPQLSGPTSFAYQVERARFDEILLRNAAATGVDVREGVTARTATEHDGRVTGVVVRDADGAERTVTARHVVDASGASSALHRHVGRRIDAEFFRNIAVFGYFAGGGRLPGADAGNILCAAFDEGWMWHIPLRDDLTSVGAVLTADRASVVAADPEAALRASIRRCGIVADLLGDTPRVTDGMYGRVRTRRDYSYTRSSFWRPGMTLVGDAACFVDPVFSTGVHLATYAGLLAARSINSALAGDLDEARAFGEFEARYRREYAVFYEFLTAFYDMQADERSYYWSARKVTGSTDSDLEAFATLVAGVASREHALTGAAGARERLAASSRSLDDAVARTGPMQTAAGERMFHLFGTPVVGDVMAEMNRIQTRGVRGEHTDEGPLLPAGLVASPDALAWAEPARPAR